MNASLAPSSTFAAVLWPERATSWEKAARAVALVFAGSLLLTVSAKVQVPFWPVPMTLQTMAVHCLGAALGARLGALAVVLYIVEGAMGFPVFAGTPPAVASPAYLLGPTGGYLMGFVLSALLIGKATERGFCRRPLLFTAALVAGDAIVLSFGWAWLAFFAHMTSGAMGIGGEKSYFGGVQPFLLGGGVKVGLSALLLPMMWHMIRKKSPD